MHTLLVGLQLWVAKQKYFSMLEMQFLSNSLWLQLY